MDKQQNDINPIINLYKFNHDFSKLSDYFARLPPDPYVPGGFRHHSVSCFKYLAQNSWQQQPHQYIFQDAYTNPVAGGVKRQYPQVETAILDEPLLQLPLQHFCNVTNLKPNSLLDIHMLRTVTTHEQLGEAAPEGIHRDAVEYVGIFCVNRHHINEGETHLYADKAGEKPAVLNKILEPGEMLIIDDEAVFHFTDLVKPINHSGFRDVFVFTHSTLMSL